MVSPRGPIYLDTSALAKLVLPEPNSDTLGRALTGRRDVVLSELAVTELVSALARRRREGDLAVEVVERLHRALLDHLVGGVFLRTSASPDTHRAAERILLSLASLPLRAADALHLAQAIAAESRTVATFDGRMRRLAPALGLALFPESA